MGLSWTIIFTILVISFIICPGLVFLTHLFSRGSQSWLVEPCERSHGFFNQLHLAVFSLHRHLLFLFPSFHSKHHGCLRSKSVSRPFQHRRIRL